MKAKKKQRIILPIAAFLILIVELFPIAIVVMNGFKKDMDIIGGNPFQLNKFSLASYQQVFAKPEFSLGMKNSLIVGGISTTLSILTGAMASYGIARFAFKGRKVLSYSFLVSRMIPQISLVVALYMMFKFVRLKETLAALILAHCSFNIPYVIWLLLPFFASIPKDYEEAAYVDGCNKRQVFWKIFFPLVTPGIVVAAVFSFIMSWNEFLYALVLTGIKTKTAPIAVHAFMGQFMPLWGQLSAAGTLMMIPVFFFTLALQGFIIQGLTAGGIKG